MLDLFSMIAALERPRFLVDAARRGAGAYCRATHLGRIIGTVPRPGEAILRLLELEAALEAERRAPEGHYAPSRHVEVLIALLGEARHLRETRPALALVA